MYLILPGTHSILYYLAHILSYITWHTFYLILPGTHSIAHFRVTFVQMQKDCFGDIYSFEHIFKDVLFYSERGSRCHENELCRRMTENKSVKCMIYIYISMLNYCYKV